MNLKKSEIAIIRLLISTNDYISSYDIATATGINRRNVRNEMTSVKIILKSLGCTLISKSSKGYSLENVSSVTIKEISNALLKYESNRDTMIPTEPLERQNYMIKKLIDKDDYIKIDDFADELLISRSTITNDLKAAKTHVKKYHLSMSQKPNYGLKIIGKEVDKRKPLADHTFEKLQSSSMFFDYLKTFTNNPNSTEMFIINTLNDKSIYFSDIAMIDLLLSISIMVERVMTSHTIEDQEDISNIIFNGELDAAETICDLLEEQYKTEFNQYERNQLAILIMCKRSTAGLEEIQDSYIQKINDKIKENIYKETLISFKSNKFNSVLSLYIKYSFYRVRFNEKIRTPLFEDVKTAYPIAYHLAEITDKVLYSYTKSRFSSSELAFFTIFYSTALNASPISKKNVLIICGLGGSSIDYIYSSLLNKFSNLITIRNRIQYYQLHTLDLSEYDFIISTVPIHETLAIPIVNISQIITNEDFDTIARYLSLSIQHIRLETLMSPNLFVVTKKVTSKENLLQKLYIPIKKQFNNIDDSFIKNLILKKQTNTIFYKNNIALISSNKALNNTTIVEVLISQTPFNYDKHDVSIFVFISSHARNDYTLNYFNEQLTILSHDKEVIDHILDNPSYINFLSHLIKGKEQ